MSFTGTITVRIGGEEGLEKREKRLVGFSAGSRESGGTAGRGEPGEHGRPLPGGLGDGRDLLLSDRGEEVALEIEQVSRQERGR